MDKLTPQQALEQGYTHYTIDQTEHYGRITDLLEPWFKDEIKEGKFLVLEKEKHAFSISAETIHGLLQDYVTGQEEYYNEDDSLVDELAEADFDKIAELVNVGFEERFMFPTEIELDLTGLEESNG